MTAPTSPRKRALMPSSRLRKALRAAGHHLAAVVQVGKDGASDAVLRQLDAQLLAHELVKVKIGAESPEDRFEVAARLGEAAGARIAQILGRTVLVYRKHPDRPRFEPGEGERPEPGGDPSRVRGRGTSAAGGSRARSPARRRARGRIG
jgi:RNA-binding protein